MKNIILQGLPGVGKTTLIKKIREKLLELQVRAAGFYTEEIRDDAKSRIGFDIINFDNKRAILARKSGNSKFKVGSYNVHVEEFEALALPIFEKETSMLVVDEIGKMELCSEKFEIAVRKAIKDNATQVIATIPLRGNLKLITEIKNDSNSQIFTVDKKNRDVLLDEIISHISIK